MFQDHLHIQNYVRVVLREGNADSRQTITKPARVTLKVLSGSNRPIHTTEIRIVSLASDHPLRHCQDVWPKAQQINLDEVRITLANILLFVEIRLSAWPGVFVRRADGFNDRHN